jgi:hypothetical protein
VGVVVASHVVLAKEVDIIVVVIMGDLVESNI